MAFVLTFWRLGDDFWEEFLRSTRNWSPFWCNNRVKDLACAIDKADADTVNEGIDVILKLHVPLINQRKNISSYSLKCSLVSSAEHELARGPTVFDKKIKQDQYFKQSWRGWEGCSVCNPHRRHFAIRFLPPLEFP
jgi:hypothetical protein